MYLPQISCKTQGIRKAFIHSLTNDRHYNIKSLKNIDKDLARTYTNTKYYGGSLKSFWNKVKKFGKKVINAPAQIASKIYPYMKKGIDFLSKNQTAKNIINSIPKVGPAINVGLDGLSKITDGVDKIIDNIKNKNPAINMNQAKDLLNNIKTTVDNVVDKAPITEEQKKKFRENEQKVYKYLPDAIKTEGLDKVNKAAGYLPFLDTSTLTVKEKVGKGGNILGNIYRYKKPMLITKHQELFKHLPKYDPEAVGKVGGKIFGNKKTEGCGTSGRSRASDSKSGRTKLSGGSDDDLRQSIINRLKNKSGRSGASDSKSGRTSLA